METIEIDVSKVAEVEKQSDLILSEVEGFKIINNDQYLSAGERLKQVRGFIKALDEQRKSVTRPLDMAKKRFMDMFRPAEERAVKAANIIERAVLDWRTEQQRIAREQEEKLRREAEAKAAAERKRLEERAAKAAENGNEDKAEALLDKAASVAPVAVSVAPQVAKVEGMSFRETWKGEVTDLAALVKAVAAGQAPITFLQANSTAINSMARSVKGTMTYPGVKFYAETSTAMR